MSDPCVSIIIPIYNAAKKPMLILSCYEDILFSTTAFNKINKLVSVGLNGCYYSRKTMTLLEQYMDDKRINDYIYTAELPNF